MESTRSNRRRSTRLQAAQEEAANQSSDEERTTSSAAAAADDASSSSKGRPARRAAASRNTATQQEQPKQQRPTRRSSRARSSGKDDKSKSKTSTTTTTTSTQRASRKRSGSDASSSHSSASSSKSSTAFHKKRRKTGDLKVVAAGDKSSFTKLQTVTPSPAAAAAASTGTAFAFDTPRRKRPTLQPLLKRSQSKTPRGVADLYPSVDDESDYNALTTNNDTTSTLVLCCSDCNGMKESCSPESLTAEYIKVYGKDHWDALHAMDRPVIVFPSASQEETDDDDVEGGDEHKDHQDGDEYDSDRAVYSEEHYSDERYSSSSQSSSSTTSSATGLRTPSRRRNNVSRKFWTKYQSGGITEMTPNTLFPHQGPQESSEFLTEIGQSDLSPKMRAILVDWLIELSEHFHFGRATLHLAITMADRVLASGPFSVEDESSDNHDDDIPYYDDEEVADDVSFGSKNYKIRRSRYQLLGGTCTWMACKLLELNPPKVSEIAYVSDGFYSIAQVKSMERRVCNALKFAFFQEPSPHQFLLEFLRASYEGDRLLQNDCEDTSCQHSYCGIKPSTTSTLSELANYLLELGRISFTPVTEKPSLLAAAAVYLARVTTNVRSPAQPKPSCDRNGFWTPTLRHYSGYSKDDLKETVLTIHAYQMAAEGETKLNSTFSKYKSRKYHRVALKTVVPRDQLGFDGDN